MNALFKSRKDVQNFKKQVYESLVDDGLYIDSVLNKSHLYKRPRKGKACKIHLKSLPKSSEKELKKGDKNLNKLAEITSRIGLNIFLLNKLDSQLLKELSTVTQSHSKENLGWNTHSLSHPYFDSLNAFDELDLGGGSFGDGGYGADGDNFDGGSDFY